MGEPLSDEDRIAQATVVRVSKGRTYYRGPLERQRCAKHPTRWETYRWYWDVGEGENPLDAIGDSDVTFTRTYGACADEYERSLE